MIVGARPHTIWHSCGNEVQQTSIQVLDSPGFKVFRVYRMGGE